MYRVGIGTSTTRWPPVTASTSSCASNAESRVAEERQLEEAFPRVGPQSAVHLGEPTAEQQILDDCGHSIPYEAIKGHTPAARVAEPRET